MLREQLSDSLKDAMRAKEKRKTSTLRLILAAIKDRDIAAREHGNVDGVSDDDVLQILSKMVKQRNESISTYEEAGRLELAEQEREEIVIIETFLPRQMREDEIEEAVKGMVDEIGAQSLKDMGKVMGALKEKYAGHMDFGRASSMAKQFLT